MFFKQIFPQTEKSLWKCDKINKTILYSSDNTKKNPPRDRKKLFPVIIQQISLKKIIIPLLACKNILYIDTTEKII